MSSYISTDSDIKAPRFGAAWRDDRGTIHGTVDLNGSRTYLSFDSTSDVRAVISACVQTLEAMERLAAEGKDGSDG